MSRVRLEPLDYKSIAMELPGLLVPPPLVCQERMWSGEEFITSAFTSAVLSRWWLPRKPCAP